MALSVHVLRKYVLFNFNFKLKIECHFRGTDSTDFFDPILIQNQFQKTKIKIFEFIFWFQIKK